MKKNVMLVVALLASTMMFGQRHKDPETRAQARREKMKTVLSLGEDQYAQVKRINERYALQLADLRSDTVNGRIEKRTSLRNLHAAREKEINTVLTPEQETQWKAYKAERARKRKAHIGQVRNNYQNRVRHALALTDNQFARMQEADKTFTEQLRALRSGSKGSLKADKATVEKLKSEHETSVKSILTPEQFEKWIALRAEMKSRRLQRRG